jgi:hypothetical protein
VPLPVAREIHPPDVLQQVIAKRGITRIVKFVRKFADDISIVFIAVLAHRLRSSLGLASSEHSIEDVAHVPLDGVDFGEADGCILREIVGDHEYLIVQHDADWWRCARSVRVQRRHFSDV